MNITEALWRSCANFPDRPALVFEGNAVSYAALVRSVAVVSGRLIAAGVRQGDVVGVGVRSPAAFVILLLALARMGVTATTYKESWGEDMKQALLRRNRVKTLIRDARDTWSPGQDLGIQCLSLLALFGPGQGNDADQLPPMAEEVEDQWWWIALSSGTTGVPKSIPHSHRHSLLSMMMLTRVGHPDQKRVFVFVDMNTVMALSAVIRVLTQGNALILTESATPENFFRIVRRDSPTRVVTTTGMAAGLIRYAAAHRIDLASCASINTFQVGGSVVPPGLRTSIEKYICGNLEVSYGATEAAGLAQLNSETYREQPESAGKLFPWVQAQAVDEDDQPLAPGTEGVLRFKSDITTKDGYLDDPAATARAFRGGWFYSGDRGSITPGGFIMLAGRAGNVINLGGTKLNAEVIEAVLNAHPAVLESTVFGVAGELTGVEMLVAAVVLKGEVGADELRGLCAAKLGKHCAPRHVMFVDALPKNAGGKVMRDELKAGLRLVRHREGQPTGSGAA